MCWLKISRRMEGALQECPLLGEWSPRRLSALQAATETDFHILDLNLTVNNTRICGPGVLFEANNYNSVKFLPGCSLQLLALQRHLAHRVAEQRAAQHRTAPGWHSLWSPRWGRRDPDCGYPAQMVKFKNLNKKWKNERKTYLIRIWCVVSSRLQQSNNIINTLENWNREWLLFPAVLAKLF